MTSDEWLKERIDSGGEIAYSFPEPGKMTVAVHDGGPRLTGDALDAAFRDGIGRIMDGLWQERYEGRSESLKAWESYLDWVGGRIVPVMGCPAELIGEPRP